MLQQVGPIMVTYVCRHHGPYSGPKYPPPDVAVECPICLLASTLNEPVEPAVDPLVEHPAHYTQGGIECIDAIRAQLSHEEWIGYLRGQIAKYNWRLRTKGNPKQDAKKAQFYLKLLIEEI